jgi:YD repeat-containing protein
MSCTYDNRRRETFCNFSDPTTPDITDSNGTAFRTIAYTLDPTGRRTSRTENAASDSYGYDPTGQLTAATYASGANATYDYDATGNRETVTGTVPGSGNYTANALNQYLSAQSQTPAYDTRGNLTGFAGWTHTYDSKNRLLNTTNGTTTVATTFDFRNRAVSRTINGVTTYFVWDDWSLIEERDASGTLIQKYIQGPGIDNLLEKPEGVGPITYN